MSADPHHPEAYKKELRAIARDLQKAELELQKLRYQRGRAFWRWHKEGIPMSALAQAAAMSTSTAKRELDRFQREEILPVRGSKPRG